tara:strand:+ start:656 stop:811 length:156 start_codon:yes stop_codon:yes gene_type:complete
MRSFKDFIIESKKSKAKKKKKEPTVEIMPTFNDGQKGMVTKVDNAGAGNAR